MFKPQPHIGCNINDRSIELIVLDENSSPLRILAKARTELNPKTFLDGHITDEPAFRRALRSIRAQAGFADRETIHMTLSISEQLVFPFSVIQPAQATSQQLATLITEEAQKKIPLSLEFQKIFIIKETITQPVIFGYAIDKRIIDSYETVLTSERFKIDHIEPDSIALVRYILPDVTLHQQVTLIDVGANITHIITVKDGYPILSQHVPFGAETLKKSVDIYALTPTKIPQTVRAFAEDIAARIKRADEFLEQYENPGHHAIRILGGGSLLPHLSEIIERESGSPVSPGNAAHLFATEGLSKKELPIFAHAVGSALRNVSKTVGRSLIPLHQFTASSKKGFSVSLETMKKRIWAGLFASVAIIVLVAILLIISHNTNNKTINAANGNQNTSDSKTALSTFSLDLADPAIASSITYTTKTAEEKTTVQTTSIHTTTGFAQGTVRLFNTSSSERPLVSGTRLATSDGIILKTQQDVIIPAEGSIDIIAQADREGATGNISSGIRLSVPGLSTFNQQYTYGITQENFSGGVVTKRIVGAHDIEQAKKTLSDLILARFKKEIAETQNETQKTVLLDSQISISIKSEPKVDSESQTVTVTATLAAPTLSIQSDALVRIAEQHLENNGQVQQIDIASATYDNATKTGTASITVRYIR